MGIYFYIRVSTQEQNEARQLDAALELRVPQENIYIDKQSGKNAKRPQLKALMQIVKPGDTVIVEAISRFARNTKDLLDLVERLAARGVEFISQKERIDTSTPTGKFMLTVFGAVAELERGYILQRQAEGIAAARKRGVHMGRPLKRSPENFAELVKLWEQGKIDFTEILKQTGLKKATFYNRLREYRNSKRK